MIAELEEAISKARQLKDEEQLEIAKIIEEEMKWDKALKNNPGKLNMLAQEALDEHRKGKPKE